MNYALCIVQKSIDPDGRDKTVFAALYSPRHRWRGIFSRHLYHAHQIDDKVDNDDSDENDDNDEN
ncbi:MAG: hypothetical protein K2L45_02460 [Muribaculaceae bacterium]|nr:hypothetical protein [Muribaculaceae bacterium]